MNRKNSGETFTSLRTYSFKKALDNNTIRESIMNNRASVQSLKGYATDLNFDTRASILGQPLANKKDFKTTANKFNQKNNINKVLDFLSKSNYQHTTTAKILNIPSQTTFSQIFEFIYGFLDVNFISPPKFDPETYLKAIKDIGYTSNISRSTLSFGSIMSWHHLISLFIWMIDLIDVACQVQPEIFNLFKYENNIDEALVHNYEAEMFKEIYRDHCENDGKNIKDICENQVLLYTTNDQAKVEDDEKKIIMLEDELQHLNLKLEEMERWKVKRIEAEKESRELLVYREKSRNHVNLVHEEYSRAVSLAEILETKLASAQDEFKELTLKLTSQTEVIGDSKQFTAKRNALTQEIEAVKLEVTQFSAGVAIQEVTMAQLFEKVKNYCETIVSKLIKHDSYPVACASGAKLELRPAQIDGETLQLILKQLRADVAADDRIFQSLKRQLGENVTNLEKLKEENESSVEPLADVQAQLRVVEKEFTVQKEKLNKEAADHAAVYKDLLTRMEEVKCQLKESEVLRDELLEQLTEEVSKISQVRDRYERKEFYSDEFIRQDERLLRRTISEMEESSERLYETMVDMMCEQQILP